MYRSFLRAASVVLAAAAIVVWSAGCSVEASPTESSPVRNAAEAAPPAAPEVRKGSTIKIEPNSPADTVRVFYNNLRLGKIREAIYLTNLRPAIEGLTDAELKEFEVDFEAIGKRVPAEIEINGEVVSGDTATVTAKLPNEDFDKIEFQQIKLRNENGVWIILTVDEASEKRIRAEGKNYFYALRIETHEDEARDMLDRIAKAQMAFATQNKGTYGEMQQLIDAEFLPADVRSSTSTGYNYAITLSADRKSYSASAVPAVYGKTGKRVFTVELNEGGHPRLSSRDGKPN